MKAEDNSTLLELVLKQVNTFKGIWPEHILLGFVKLLQNKAYLEGLLQDSSQQELLEAKALLSEEDLDYLQMNLQVYLGQEVNAEIKDSIASLEADLTSNGATRTLKEILKHALKRATIQNLFEQDKFKDDLEELEEVLETEFDELEKANEKFEAEYDKLEELQKCETYLEIAQTTTNTEAEQAMQSLDTQFGRYTTALENLKKKIVGQDKAIMKFIKGMYDGSLFMDEEATRPHSYHFFFGPPGVGKTMLAQMAGEEFGMPCKVFPMANYASKNAYRELIGNPPSYQAAEEGALTRFVLENPKSIVVFDEIEKADISVIRMFLELLGNGVLTSGYSQKVVSFKETVLIFTSNVGKKLYQDRSLNLSELPEKVLVDAVSRETKPDSNEPVLPPEICSRIASGNIVVFNHLKTSHLIKIINQRFDRFVKLMREQHNIEVEIHRELANLYLLSRGADIDARIAANKSMDFLKEEIFKLLMHSDAQNTENAIKKIKVDIRIKGTDRQIFHLFESQKKPNLLFLADACTEMQDKLEKKNRVFWAKDLEEARKYLEQDIDAIFINPMHGPIKENVDVLSVIDSRTLGNEFFNELIKEKTEIPVVIATPKELASIEKGSFILKGAYEVIKISNHVDEFVAKVNEIMSALYREKNNREFTQRGLVIDYKTSPKVINGVYTITFYDLNKRLAAALESKNQENTPKNSILVHDFAHAFMADVEGLAKKPSYVADDANDRYSQRVVFDKEKLSNTKLLGLIRYYLAGQVAEELFKDNESDKKSESEAEVNPRQLNLIAEDSERINVDQDTLSDLKNASKLAFAYVCQYNLNNDNLFTLSPEQVMKNPALVKEYMDKANALLVKEKEHTRTILSTYQPLLKPIISILEKERYQFGKNIADLIEVFVYLKIRCNKGIPDVEATNTVTDEDLKLLSELDSESTAAETETDIVWDPNYCVPFVEDYDETAVDALEYEAAMQNEKQALDIEKDILAATHFKIIDVLKAWNLEYDAEELDKKAFEILDQLEALSFDDALVKGWQLLNELRDLEENYLNMYPEIFDFKSLDEMYFA